MGFWAFQLALRMRRGGGEATPTRVFCSLACHSTRRRRIWCDSNALSKTDFPIFSTKFTIHSNANLLAGPCLISPPFITIFSPFNCYNWKLGGVEAAKHFHSILRLTFLVLSLSLTNACPEVAWHNVRSLTPEKIIYYKLTSNLPRIKIKQRRWLWEGWVEHYNYLLLNEFLISSGVGISSFLDGAVNVWPTTKLNCRNDTDEAVSKLEIQLGEALRNPSVIL